MTDEERVIHLLSYLRELKSLNESGFYCNKEITETIKELRSLLSIK